MANSFVYYNSIDTRHICVDNVVTKYYYSMYTIRSSSWSLFVFCTFVLGMNFIVVWQNSSSWTHLVSWFFKHAGEEVDFYFRPQWGCTTLLRSKKNICVPRSNSLKICFFCLKNDAKIKIVVVCILCILCLLSCPMPNAWNLLKSYVVLWFAVDSNFKS